MTDLRIVGKRPSEAPVGWRVYNAPRPLPGHKTWQGEFQHGIFYAAIDPDQTDELGAAWEQGCRDLDGWLIEWIDFATARAELVDYYRTEYGSEIDVEAELAEFNERQIVQMWAAHFARPTERRD